mmetsp:Transcript_42967/g.139432  ORF Transcript_42967/g.139432 Transcript_42967/m.139432 type:complete len:313 (-) Transcript_42967:2827-3765(-)
MGLPARLRSVLALVGDPPPLGGASVGQADARTGRANGRSRGGGERPSARGCKRGRAPRPPLPRLRRQAKAGGRPRSSLPLPVRGADHRAARAERRRQDDHDRHPHGPLPAVVRRGDSVRPLGARQRHGRHPPPLWRLPAARPHLRRPQRTREPAARRRSQGALAGPARRRPPRGDARECRPRGKPARGTDGQPVGRPEAQALPCLRADRRPEARVARRADGRDGPRLAPHRVGGHGGGQGGPHDRDDDALPRRGGRSRRSYRSDAQGAAPRRRHLPLPEAAVRARAAPDGGAPTGRAADDRAASRAGPAARP